MINYTLELSSLLFFFSLSLFLIIFLSFFCVVFAVNFLQVLQNGSKSKSGAENWELRKCNQKYYTLQVRISDEYLQMMFHFKENTLSQFEEHSRRLLYGIRVLDEGKLLLQLLPVADFLHDASPTE